MNIFSDLDQKSFCLGDENTLKEFLPLKEHTMCPSSVDVDACNRGDCCGHLYNLFCRVFELYHECPPNPAVAAVFTFNDNVTGLVFYLGPVFNQAKCGKLYCCDGFIDALVCSYKFALAALSTTTDLNRAQDIVNQLGVITMNIRAVMGFPFGP